MKKFLFDKAKEFDISLSDVQLNQFQIFYDMLIETNKVMNLTAITEEKEVVIKHFVDSISAIKYFNFSSCSTVIDIGTGAGFPGIPLAIMFPDIKFTLVDSLNKRLRFINMVAEKANINNIITVHGRAEDLAKEFSFRDHFDVCVSRAVANLSTLLEYCIPYVNKGGKFISYKSVLAEDELKNSQNAQSVLKCKLIDNISFEIDDDYQRCFLIFEKMEKTNNKYPRQAGTPKKNPL